jgi:hypothetical protein
MASHASDRAADAWSGWGPPPSLSSPPPPASPVHGDEYRNDENAHKDPSSGKPSKNRLRRERRARPACAPENGRCPSRGTQCDQDADDDNEVAVGVAVVSLLDRESGDGDRQATLADRLGAAIGSNPFAATSRAPANRDRPAIADGPVRRHDPVGRRGQRQNDAKEENERSGPSGRPSCWTPVSNGISGEQSEAGGTTDGGHDRDKRDCDDGHDDDGRGGQDDRVDRDRAPRGGGGNGASPTPSAADPMDRNVGARRTEVASSSPSSGSPSRPHRARRTAECPDDDDGGGGEGHAPASAVALAGRRRPSSTEPERTAVERHIAVMEGDVLACRVGGAPSTARTSARMGIYVGDGWVVHAVRHGRSSSFSSSRSYGIGGRHRAKPRYEVIQQTLRDFIGTRTVSADEWFRTRSEYPAAVRVRRALQRVGTEWEVPDGLDDARASEDFALWAALGQSALTVADYRDERDSPPVARRSGRSSRRARGGGDGDDDDEDDGDDGHSRRRGAVATAVRVGGTDPEPPVLARFCRHTDRTSSSSTSSSSTAGAAAAASGGGRARGSAAQGDYRHAIAGSLVGLYFGGPVGAAIGGAAGLLFDSAAGVGRSWRGY